MEFCIIEKVNNSIAFFFLSFRPTSTIPQHAHYWVVEFQSQNSGYTIDILCPSLFRIMCYFFLSSNDVSGPPLPPLRY